jgi:hypothetical protein
MRLGASKLHISGGNLGSPLASANGKNNQTCVLDAKFWFGGFGMEKWIEAGWSWLEMGTLV